MTAPRGTLAPGTRLGPGLCAGLALAAAALSVLYALAIVPGWRLPGLPYAPLPRTALLLVAGGLVGLAFSAGAALSGLRRTGTAASIVLALAMVVALVPIVALARTGSEHGVTLSPVEGVFGDENVGSPDPARSVTYVPTDDQPLQLDVWRPTPPADPRGAALAIGGVRPRPAVVWVHGGGWVSGTRGSTPKWDRLLSEAGYTVFDIDYRLAPPARWNQAPGDVKCAVAWVRAHAGDYAVDPARIVLAGESAGGHLALLAAYAGDDPRLPSSCPAVGADSSVAAVVAVYPVTDMVRFWQDDTLAGAGRLWVSAFLGGAPDPGTPLAAAAVAVSPTTYVRAGLPPTLLVHGEADVVVPADHSRRLDELLGAAGVPHETVWVPYSDHAFDHDWGSLGSQITRHAVVDFVSRQAPTH